MAIAPLEPVTESRHAVAAIAARRFATAELVVDLPADNVWMLNIASCHGTDDAPGVLPVVWTVSTIVAMGAKAAATPLDINW